MPMIIDVTGKNTRAINQAAQGLEQTPGLLLGLVERRDRQEAERQRMAFADREFQFAQQQAQQRQANTDREFEQRQGLVQREIGQEDAQADFWRSKLLEMNPGPVGADQFNGLDGRTLKGLYDAQRYEQELGKARDRATTVWRQNLMSMGIEDPNDPMAQQVGMLIQNAGTLEELEQARQSAYRVYAEAEAMKRDGEVRAMTIEQTQPMRMVLQTRPREAAAASVLDRQFLNGELDFKGYWAGLGDVLEAASGGGGERPTVNRIAFGKGLDALAQRFASDSEMTIEEFEQQRSALGAALGIEGFTAPAPARAAPNIAPDAMRTAQGKIRGITDEAKRETIALTQARKLLTDAGKPADAEAIIDLAQQLIDSL